MDACAGRMDLLLPSQKFAGVRCAGRRAAPRADTGSLSHNIPVKIAHYSPCGMWEWRFPRFFFSIRPAQQMDGEKKDASLLQDAAVCVGQLQSLVRWTVCFCVSEEPTALNLKNGKSNYNYELRATFRRHPLRSLSTCATTSRPSHPLP